jgi:5'-nucleotidase
MPVTTSGVARTVACAAVAVLAIGACSSSTAGDAGAKGATGRRPAPTGPLEVLVTNDDGYTAPGISAVTEALRALPDVRVTVVAPSTNQSGSGGKTSSLVGPLPGTQHTAAGYRATAVTGYPADAVDYALGPMHLTPDVVVSGINLGQTLGAVATISGTVGAAKRAAAAGIPAIAVSQGLGADVRYADAARLTADWIRARRDALAGHHAAVGVVNLNVPTCTSGTVRGVRQVPLATTVDGALAAADCASTVTTVRTDIEAFHNGFAAVTQLTAAAEPVTSSTTFSVPKKSS